MVMVVVGWAPAVASGQPLGGIRSHLHVEGRREGDASHRGADEGLSGCARRGGALRERRRVQRRRRVWGRAL
eukprot:1621975-Pleurochrysis_carterae.AAC.2